MTEDNPESLILKPLPLKYSDYKYSPPCLVELEELMGEVVFNGNRPVMSLNESNNFGVIFYC